MSARALCAWLVAGLLLAGCGSERRTVYEGSLQKRRHQPGWHVDLGLRAQTKQRVSLRTQRLAVRMPDGSALCMEMPGPVPIAVTAQRPTTYLDRSRVPPRPVRSEEMPVDAEHSVVRTTSPMQVPVDITPERRWNRLAVPAFVVALGAVALALFTTSTIAVIAALVVAFVLSGISIKQIRWREERGKGFAVAALVIAVMASIATAIVTAVVGFV